MYDISPMVAYFTPVMRPVFVPPGGKAQATQVNNNRPILYLANVSNAVLQINPPQMQDNPAGIFVLPVGSTLRFSWPEDGPMSTYEWWVHSAGSGGGNALTVIEILWQPK